MREKHALWVSAIRGNQVSAKTEARQEALRRLNIVVLAESFGWTPWEIAQLPADLHDDIVTILSLRNSLQSSSWQKKK